MTRDELLEECAKHKGDLVARAFLVCAPVHAGAVVLELRELAARERWERSTQESLELQSRPGWSLSAGRRARVERADREATAAFDALMAVHDARRAVR